MIRLQRTFLIGAHTLTANIHESCLSYHILLRTLLTIQAGNLQSVVQMILWVTLYHIDSCQMDKLSYFGTF